MVLRTVVGILLSLICLVWCVQAEAGYLGCYRKTKPFPSAGNYNTSTVNPSICRTQCGSLGYENAVLFSGRFCLCSNSLPDELAADDNCTEACPGSANGEACGGRSFYSIYRARQEIRGVEVTPGEFVVGFPGTVQATVATGNASFSVDFGDGAGRSGWNDSGVFQKTFSKAGTYLITVYAGDREGVLQEKQSAIPVTVQEPVSGVQMSCPLVSHSYEVSCCNVSVAVGSQMEVTANYGDGSNETFSITDPRRRGVGPAIPIDGLTETNSSIGVHIMPQSEILEPGTIVNFEYYASSTGAIDLMVLRPTCSGGTQYCCSSNTCETACHITALQHSCPSLFSTVRACCISTPGGNCNDPERSALPTANHYTVVYLMTHTVSAIGYGFVSASSPFDVTCGDVIGYVSQGGTLVTRPTTGSEKSDLKRNTTTANLNDVIAIPSDVRPAENHRHFLRAVYSRPALVKLCHSYTSAGYFMTNLTVANKMIPDKVYLSAPTEVLTGINETVIISPEYFGTGMAVPFEMTPHTGHPLTYDWEVSDGFSNTTTVPKLTHTFSATGVYTITVRAYKSIVEKSNFTTIIIQDPVTRVYVATDNDGILNQAHIIYFNVTGGSDYNCTVDFGDSSTPETILDSALDPGTTGKNLTHVYSVAGNIIVEVTCANMVSNVTATETVLFGEEVSGLRILREGGQLNVPYHIEFEIAAGSNVAFMLLVNGTQYLVDFNATAKRGRSTVPIFSASVSLMNITLKAFNTLSQETTIVYFTIDEEILSPTLSVNSHYVTFNENVVFAVTMAGGTSVNVYFDFGDGTTSLFSTPPASAWVDTVPDTTLTRNHAYSRGGEYTVVVNVYNGHGNHSLSQTILVISLIGNLTLLTNSPVQFLLTGQAEFVVAGGGSIAGSLIEMTYGDGTNPVSQEFIAGHVYTHEYKYKGIYSASVNVSNPVSYMVLNTTIELMEPIQDMRLSCDPAHATVNLPIRLKIKMYRGENVRFYVNFGDSANIEEIDRQGERSEDEDTLSHTYTLVGNYTITVAATSPLGNTTKTYYIAVQNPVLENDFTVTSSAPTSASSGTVYISVVFSGSTLPTESSITVLWGRGGQSYTLLDCSTSPCNKTLSRAASTGVHSCTVIVSNLATRVEFSMDTSFYEPVAWVSARAMYQPFIPLGGPDIEGFQGNMFPVTRDVKFFINSTGTVRDVDITAHTDDMVDLIHCIKTENPVTVLFPVAGRYIVNITAQNPFSQSSTVLNINIAEPVDITDITDDGIVRRPDENKTIEILFKSVGTESCVYVEFDDAPFSVYGSQSRCAQRYNVSYNGPITNRTIVITTMFHISGQKLMKVRGFNDLSDVSRTFTFTISEVNCEPPEVQIYQQSPDFFSPQVVIRSDWFVLQGNTLVKCQATLQNAKQWTAQEVNETTGSVIREVPLDNLPTASNSELFIKPRFLNYGVYKLSFATRMLFEQTTVTDEFSNSVFTYVKVVESPLVVAVIDQVSSKIRLGHGRPITLSPGAYSLDLDLNPGEAQSFTGYEYLCRRVGENFIVLPGGEVPYDVSRVNLTHPDTSTNATRDLGGCFGTGPGVINGSSEEMTISTINMKVNTTYEFFVVVYKGSRKGYTILQVEIVDGDPPEIAIKCGVGDTVSCNPNENSQVVRWQSRIALTSQCSYGCHGSNVVYKWDLEVESQEGEFIIWHNVTSPANYIDSHNGTASSTISIKPSIFNIKFNVTRIKVKLEAKREGSSRGGLAELTLKVNPPPRGGNCSVSPNISTVTADRNWTVECTGWIDNDAVSSYTFYAIKNGSIHPVMLGIKPNGFLKTTMPLGPAAYNYWLTVFVNISDTFGSTVTVEAGRIQVNPVSSTAALQLCDELSADGDQNPLSQITANGNLEDTAQYILSMASVINSQGCAGDDGDTSPGSWAQNRSAEENERIRQAGADIRSKMVKALLASPSETPNQVIVKSNSLTTVLDNPSEIPRGSQEEVTEIVTSFVDNFKEFAEDLTKEETETLANAILGNIGDILKTSVSHISNPLVTDVQDSLSKAFYNTDLEDQKLKAIDGMSKDKAVNGFARMTNDDNQKAVTGDAWTKMSQAVDSILKILSEKTVLGEGPYTLDAPHMNVTLVKTTVAELENMEQPSVKFSQGSLSAIVALDQDVTSQVVEYKFNPVKFLEGTGSYQIADSSRGLSIDILDGSGQIIDISNTPSTIEIMVKREHSNPIPEPFHVSSSQAPMSSHDRLAYRSLWVNESDVSLHIEIVPEEYNATFLVLVRHEQAPLLEAGQYDAWQLIPSSRVDKDGVPLNSYEIFLDSLQIGNKTGKYYIGLRQLMNNETHMYGLNWNNFGGNFTETFTGEDRLTTNYTMRVFTSSCVFLSRGVSSLSKDDCVVGNETTHHVTQCICNHLTTFLGGWVVMPNTIDWNFVFSGAASFDRNATLYITEMVIFVIYILMAVWARRQDKKDVEKLGVSPLPDNDPVAHYLYEIVIFTGMRRDAGTDSKVFFILSGEHDETDVRTVSDDKRSVFKRGSVDRFLMAVKRPLGALNYARIWHDNSGKGKFASWYLKYFLVHDLQSKEKYYFICNRWFAVEEDDGQVDRLIPVAGREQMAEFGHLFTQTTQKNLGDGHLWFSVIARPAQSRFTRLQRVSCCLCLLYLTMLSSALFYGQVPETPGSNAITLGPFNLSPEQIFVGIMGTVIVFPINLLIITLFRKSRPKKKRPSRIQAALKKNILNQSNVSLNTTTKSTETLWPASIHTEKNQMTDLNKAKNSDVSKTFTNVSFKARPETSLSSEITKLENTMEQTHEDDLQSHKKKKKKFDLPWWCTIVAWVILWISVFSAAAMVTFYGIQFQDTKARKWITSMLISFITSVFFTEPIKIFLMAIFFSLIIKKVDEDEEEEEAQEDEEDPQLQHDEQWLHSPTNKTLSPVKPRTIAYKPPDPLILEQARENRLKELKMYDIIREIIFYSLFIWMLMVISYGNRNPYNYFLREHLENEFVFKGHTTMDFTALQNSTHFWHWYKEGLVPALRAMNWYNNDFPIGQRGFLADRACRMMGYATMRQVRVKPAQCQVEDIMKNLFTECNEDYSIIDEEERPFGVGWTPFNGTSTQNNSAFEYEFRTSSELDGYPFYGALTIYGGGGYVAQLRGSYHKLLELGERLEREWWIDKYTRAVLIEFTCYNPSVNLFSINTMAVEFHQSGGIVPEFRFEPVTLLNYVGSAMAFQVACEVIYFIFIFFFLYKESRKIWRMRCSYFFEFWNLVEFSIIGFSIGGAVVFFYRMIITNGLTKTFKTSHGNEYIKFQYVGYWNETLSYMLGTLCFLGTLKFLKLLRFNKRMSFLAATLKDATQHLFAFTVIFFIIFFAFVQFFTLDMGSKDYSFANLLLASESLMQMMLGKFDFYRMAKTSELAPYFFVLFVVLVTWITLNMLLSILNESFTAVKADLSKQTNEYEMVDFIVNRFKLWTGLGTPTPVVPPAPTPDKLNNELGEDGDKLGVSHFPETVDKFLNSIGRVYFDLYTSSGKDAFKKMLKDNKLKARVQRGLSNSSNKDAEELAML